ncbi:MAG: hypothetical protein SVY10_11450 [Thermodesulfobacteriota bacterium]|nr:hypothetical protein [Thermodesulfobacteriota bacterium]
MNDIALDRIVMAKNELSRDIGWLKMDIERLSQEVASLKRNIGIQKIRSLKEMIQRRGLKICKENATEMTLIPKDIPQNLKNAFYEMLKKYSFRLFLRDMIQKGNSFEVESLTRYCCTKSAKKYLDFLEELGVIQVYEGDKYMLAINPVHSFGPTLEWYVSEIFKREFLCPALYGVNFKDTSAGGDYDVLAQWEQYLIYVEVKSSPPKGIEINEITAFVNRTKDLMPHIAVFLVDTELRMKDKIVALFEEEMKNRYGNEAERTYPVQRLVNELFHINNSLYIINSRKSLALNLLTCIRHHLNSQSMRL